MLSPAVVGHLARIVGELALVLLTAEAVVRWPGRRRLGRGAALALVVSLAVAGISIADGVNTARQLRQAHRTNVGERRGLTYCFQEDGAQSRLGFIAWLRRQLPIEATYALDFAPEIHHLYTFREGRIVRMEDFPDRQSALEAVGLT